VGATEHSLLKRSWLFAAGETGRLSCLTGWPEFTDFFVMSKLVLHLHGKVQTHVGMTLFFLWGVNQMTVKY